MTDGARHLSAKRFLLMPVLANLFFAALSGVAALPALEAGGRSPAA